MGKLSTISSTGMGLFFLCALLAFIYPTSTVAQACAPSRLDPGRYANVESEQDLRKLIGEDLAQYLAPDGALMMPCFVRDFNGMGKDRPFGAEVRIGLGVEAPGQRRYRFNILSYTAPPGTEGRTSVVYAAAMTVAGRALVLVDRDGTVIETIFDDIAVAPQTCAPSPFDPSRFSRVVSKEQMGRLIEDAILTNLSANRALDWSCFAQDFVAMDQELPERLWAVLLPGEVALDGVYRFTAENLSLRARGLSAVPGGSNGRFTAIVHAETPGEIAIVERGGHYRWLDIQPQAQ